MKDGIFLDFFPVPKYLGMPAVGFDISDCSLKYVKLRREKGFFSVSRFGTKIIPKGVIKSGEIKEKQKLVDFLRFLRKELAEEHVIVALPEEKAFLSRVRIPLMKEDEIRGALELQLEEHVPLSAEDAIFDFEMVEEVNGGENSSGHIDVNLIAFPRGLIESYRDVFRDAGFTPLVFEMEAWASARSVVPKEEKEACLIVDFGKMRTSFTVVSSGKVQFASTISVAGGHLNTALARNLNIDDYQAEKIKKEKGFVRSKDNERIFNALLPVVSVIKDEMLKHIAYWNSHLEKHNKKERQISKILLCGGDSNLFGLPEYLSYELKVPVQLCNPWVNIVSFEEHIPEIELRESLIYSTALGLALRSVEPEQ